MTLVLLLFAGLLAPPHPRSATVARAVRPAVVERKLLLIARRSRPLHRFVDPATGVVKRNVAAHCTRAPRLDRRRAKAFVCLVWRQPRPQSSGVRVLCRLRSNERLRVWAYTRAAIRQRFSR